MPEKTWIVEYIDWDLERKTFSAKIDQKHRAVEACYIAHPALRKIVDVRRYYTRDEWLEGDNTLLLS